MGAPFVLSVGRRSVRSRSFRSRNAGNLESLPQNNRQHVIGKMPELLRDGKLVEVMPKWRFRIFHLWVVHLGNRYIPRSVRVFKDFAAQMAPRLFPKLPM
jgi:hypothetical protein